MGEVDSRPKGDPGPDVQDHPEPTAFVGCETDTDPTWLALRLSFGAAADAEGRRQDQHQARQLEDVS
jgi:hypothetical protein